jgi:hypothetical protein
MRRVDLDAVCIWVDDRKPGLAFQSPFQDKKGGVCCVDDASADALGLRHDLELAKNACATPEGKHAIAKRVRAPPCDAENISKTSAAVLALGRNRLFVRVQGAIASSLGGVAVQEMAGKELKPLAKFNFSKASPEAAAQMMGFVDAACASCAVLRNHAHQEELKTMVGPRCFGVRDPIAFARRILAAQASLCAAPRCAPPPFTKVLVLDPDAMEEEAEEWDPQARVLLVAPSPRTADAALTQSLAHENVWGVVPAAWIVVAE